MTGQGGRILSTEDAVEKSNDSYLTVKSSLVHDRIQRYPSLQRMYTHKLRTASCIPTCQPEFVASMNISPHMGETWGDIVIPEMVWRQMGSVGRGSAQRLTCVG